MSTAVAERITLTEQEIRELTGYKRAADQLAELKRQGFWRARRNVLGAVVLEREHYLAVCSGQDRQPTNQPKLRAA